MTDLVNTYQSDKGTWKSGGIKQRREHPGGSKWDDAVARAPLVAPNEMMHWPDIALYDQSAFP